MYADEITTKYTASDGVTYDVTLAYRYIHRPAILSADPYDSYDDESELFCNVIDVVPRPSRKIKQEIVGGLRENEALEEEFMNGWGGMRYGY